MTPADLAFLFLPWQPSLIVIAGIIAAVVFYLRTDAPPWRQAAFWTGLVLFWLSLQSGLDYYAEHLFWAHQVQNALLHHAAPLLIALARPPLPRLKALNGPVAGPLLFSAVLVLWLIPPLHDMAMLDPRLYRLMTLSMAVNGVMFWNTVLNGPSSAPVRIAMTIAVMPVQIVAGLVLLSASADLYPVYAMCGRAGTLSALDDQHVGGAILWLSGTMMSVAFAAALAGRMLIQPRANSAM